MSRYKTRVRACRPRTAYTTPSRKVPSAAERAREQEADDTLRRELRAALEALFVAARSAAREPET